MKQLELFEYEKTTVPLMPFDYKAPEKKSCGYTKSNPREWTDKEIKWVKELKSKGYNLSDIAKSVERTEISVQIKLKRISKKENTYNDKHKILSEIDFITDNLIKEIKRIGIQNKKELIIFDYKEWQNISRVWFEIKPMKITEQWEK